MTREFVKEDFVGKTRARVCAEQGWLDATLEEHLPDLESIGLRLREGRFVEFAYDENFAAFVMEEPSAEDTRDTPLGATDIPTVLEPIPTQASFPSPSRSIDSPVKRKSRIRRVRSAAWFAPTISAFVVGIIVGAVGIGFFGGSAAVSAQKPSPQPPLSSSESSADAAESADGIRPITKREVADKPDTKPRQKPKPEPKPQPVKTPVVESSPANSSPSSESQLTPEEQFCLATGAC
jgi:hypothetical protein